MSGRDRTVFRKRRTGACRGAAVVLLLCLFGSGGATARADGIAPPPSGNDPGMRMYREGILPSGDKMRAEISEGVVVTGAFAACEKCHRRSGIGSFEGGIKVRPITGAALYRPEEVLGVGTDRALPGKAPKWTPYTDETLARAIRDGIGPDGRRLGNAMPRYDLPDADLGVLIAYLKSLSTSGAPGVTAESIRFATVVDARVPPARRNAVIDVLKTYFREKNAGTREETKRAQVAPWTRYRKLKAYRIWKLDIWEVSGPEETWGAQLERYYREQPVFALLGGVSAEGWGPVHRFCERQGIPCLFPNTDVPMISGPAYFTVYFSRGVMLEADTLAQHLETGPEETRRGPVVQVYRGDEVGTAAADAFRKAFAARGRSDVVDVRLPRTGDATGTALSELERRTGSGAIVLWLSEADLRRLAEHAGAVSRFRRLYFSSSLAGTARAAAFAAPDGGEVFVIHPFALPTKRREADRIRIWLASRKVPPGDERLQFNTFFAAGIARGSLDRMFDYFSRDYLLEWVEHMAEESVIPSAYPRLSLGPGQRFASKGCYILRYVRETGEFQPIGGWIVPERPSR